MKYLIIISILGGISISCDTHEKPFKYLVDPKVQNLIDRINEKNGAENTFFYKNGVHLSIDINIRDEILFSKVREELSAMWIPENVIWKLRCRENTIEFKSKKLFDKFQK